MVIFAEELLAIFMFFSRPRPIFLEPTGIHQLSAPRRPFSPLLRDLGLGPGKSPGPQFSLRLVQNSYNFDAPCLPDS